MALYFRGVMRDPVPRVAPRPAMHTVIRQRVVAATYFPSTIPGSAGRLQIHADSLRGLETFEVEREYQMTVLRQIVLE